MKIQDENNLNKPAFDRYIEELYKLNTNDKKRAEKIAKQGLEELGIVSQTKYPNSLGIDLEKLAIVGICLMIALCALLVPNLTSVWMFMGGIVFFLAGLLVGLNEQGFGLIFLFSHGMTGLFAIILSFFSNLENADKPFSIFNNAIFSDGGVPNELKIYLGSIIIIFIVALIYSILHNLSPVLKKNKKHMIIILLLYFVAILLTGLTTRFFPYLIP